MGGVVGGAPVFFCIFSLYFVTACFSCSVQRLYPVPFSCGITHRLYHASVLCVCVCVCVRACFVLVHVVACVPEGGRVGVYDCACVCESECTRICGWLSFSSSTGRLIEGVSPPCAVLCCVHHMSIIVRVRMYSYMCMYLTLSFDTVQS